MRFNFRYAFRSLRRTPAFTLTAVLTLALGIGANTAIFSVVQAVLLAPLPYVQPDRLVMVRQMSLKLQREMSVSYPDFLDWQRNARSFQLIAGIKSRGFDLTSPGTPEHLNGSEISADFFSTLGVKLFLGREFAPREDRHNGAPGVIISSRLWRDRFAGSPQALGKTITLDGAGHTIIGILPREFHFPIIDSSDADIYTPLAQDDPLVANDRTIHTGILCVARLNPGVAITQARAEMEAVQKHLDAQYPAEDRGLGSDVVPLKEEITGDVSRTLMLLLGAVGVVLLIACANVANLLLARSVARTREFATRLALGATRSQIAGQLIAESLLLSLAGGSLGLIAEWAVSPALAAMAGSLPRSGNIGLNLAVLAFTFGVSVSVGILFGLAVGFRRSSADLQTSLKEGTRGSTGGRHRAQRVLVIVQMALTLVLLTGASLLGRTIHKLWDVNPGFNPQHLITFKVGLSPALIKTGATMRIAYRQLIERIRQVPGVQAADLTVLVPLSQHSNAGPFWIGSQEPNYVSEAPRAQYYNTGPDYLRTMGLPLLRGRFFTPEDTTRSEPVIVIDSVLARNYFPDREPVGQTITVGHWRPARIVGVVSHVRHWGLGDPDVYTQNQIYISFYQLADESVPLFRGDVTMVVRTPLDAATVLPAIKNVVYGAGSDQPVYEVHTMQQFVSESMAPQRFPMFLLGAFAALALLLATIGIYGVISYSMTQRVREMGIRIALGAVKMDVLRMVIGQGLGLALTGVAIGAVAALILTRVLSSFSHLLYGVRTSDPLTFLAVSLTLLGATILACYIPARRATQVDAMIALRHE